MGCIVASVERIGEGISLSTSRVGDGVSLAVERIAAELNLSVNKLGEGVALAVGRIGESVNLSVGIVCSMAEASYLKVSPDVVWLVPDNGFSADFVVVSNKDWIVE